MLRILLSNEQELLLSYLMAEAKTALEKKDRQLLILVPAQATFLMDRQIIEACHVAGYMHVRTMTFEKLTAQLLSEIGGRAKKSMSIEGLSLLSADAIGRLPMQALSMSKDPEIHKKTASFIRALMQEGISPERTQELSEKIGGTAGIKLADTAKIYQEIAEQLGKTPDYADMESLACENIKDSEYVSSSDIIIYGFDVFPGRRIGYIDTLSQYTDVRLLLQGDENLSAVRRLAQLQNDIEIQHLEGKVERPLDIALAEERLFMGARAGDIKPENIRIFCTGTRETEIETAAAEILKYTQHHRMREVALVMQNPADYAHIIRDVFMKNGIPYFLGGKRSLSDSKSAEFVITALEAAEKWDDDAVLRLVKSGFLPITEEEAEQLVIYMKEYGIRGFHMKREFRRGDTEKVEALRSRAVFPLLLLEEDMHGMKTAAERIASLRRFIEETQLAAKTEERAALFEDYGLAEEAGFEKQVMEKMESVFMQMELLLHRPLHAEEFRDILSSGFSGADISTVPPMSDQVQVGSITHGIYSDVHYVIIVGANDGVLPSANADGAQLLLPHETEMLCREEEFFPGTMDSDEQKRYIKRLIKNTKKLDICYNKEAGQPSYMIAQLLSIFPQMEILGESMPVTIEGGLRMMARELRQGLLGAETKILPAYIKNLEARERLTSMIPQLTMKNIPASLTREAAKALYGGMKGSVSSIETYYSCPYRHFIDYGLRPQETESFEETAATTGTYAHAAMETLTRNILSAKEKWAELSDETLDEYVDKAAEQALFEHNREVMRESGRYAYLAKRLKEEVRYSAKAIRDQLMGTSIEVAGSEIGFGFWNDFTVKTPLGEIAIRGKIDRLDIAEADGEKYIRVVDYKTGNKGFELTELFYGVDIQLMVYLLAVLNLTKYRSAVPAGGFYFKINLPMVTPEDEYGERMKKYRMSGFLLAEKTAMEALDNGEKELFSMALRTSSDENMPIRSEAGFTREEMAAMLNYTKKLIGDAAVRIYGGNIEIRPLLLMDKLPCRYCPHLSICRVDDGNCMAKEGYKVGKQEILEALER